MDHKQRGLEGRYRVTRINEDGTPKAGHENRFYFVLDVNHDPYAIAALEAYAKECADDYPALANDLRAWALEARLDRLDTVLQEVKQEYINGDQ